MEWGSWSAFWAMGGYGAYVWGSYAVTAVVMIAELVLVRRRHRAAREGLKRARRN
ncbi:MAG: heme exporter protein CcmD [Pseudomonadota bacterium]|nr:MAG: heme exporter protein CcmD [Pseudomonadota bacterium]